MARIAIGPKHLSLNDTPLEEVVAGFRLAWDQGEPCPTLYLEVNSLNDFEVATEGNVVVSTEKAANAELGRIVKAFAALSPEKVEQQALALQEWGDGGSLTATIISVIQEQVFGTQTEERKSSGGTPPSG